MSLHFNFMLHFDRGAAGFLEHVEIDTSHFMGNFPESCELHAIRSCTNEPVLQVQEWIPILHRTKLGPHRRHFFQLENVSERSFTHVKLTIWPDGGIKRVRIIGRRAEDTNESVASIASIERNSNRNNFLADAEELLDGTDHVIGIDGLDKGVNNHVHGANVPLSMNGHVNGVNGFNTSPPSIRNSVSMTIISALPITPEAFAPFGQVLQAYTDHNAAPGGTRITPANQGTAFKYHKLALICSSYTSDSGATTGFSVYHCNPVSVSQDHRYEVNVLERHPFTNQAFIPMGGNHEDGLSSPGKAYLVVVAKNAENGGPDLSTLRAFVATASQGIVYNTAVWRMFRRRFRYFRYQLTRHADQPMTVLGKVCDVMPSTCSVADCQFRILDDGFHLCGNTSR
jgi:allantoicase